MSETVPSGEYLDRLMRRESFAALWPLFAKATKPAKELTESFSALVHLRPLIDLVGTSRVIHVGDGAHARTAALFALKTQTTNISVDPVINEPLVRSWLDEFQVDRFEWRKARVQDATQELNALPPLPVFVTFVHAHVSVDDVLTHLHWDAAYTLACCSPGHQLSSLLTPWKEDEDWGILSDERTYQVLINPGSRWADALMQSASAGAAATG